MTQSSYIRTPEHREKMRIANSGSNNLMFGRTGTAHPKYGTHLSKTTKQKMSESRTGQHASEETKQKLRNIKRGENNPRFGITLSEATRLKISNTKKQYYTTHKSKLTGRPRPPETKLKMRIAAVQRILRNGTTLSIGKNEKDILDKQEQLSGVSIIRQHPILTLGYVVDGYCPTSNTVYEVYEPKHIYQTANDLKRETEIRNLLKCDFVIIWDK